MPFDRAKYPANWPDISRRIRERAGQRCEWCGARNGQPHPITGSRVVLTVAHLGTPHYPDGSLGSKQDKLDCRDENLAALCQLHHFSLDRDDHILHAAETRRLKKIAAGQLELMPEGEART